LSRYKLVVRSGAKVEREKLDSLDSALALLEQRARNLSENADTTTVNALTRKFEPIQQVVGRVEVSGPRGLRAGVDVRGDGSVESYTGRVRRKLVEQRDGESPYEALRRELLAPLGDSL
jgi:hypothetical protein